MRDCFAVPCARDEPFKKGDAHTTTTETFGVKALLFVATGPRYY